MPLIVTRIPRTRQPQGAVRVSPRWVERPEIAWVASAPTVVRPDALGAVTGGAAGVDKVGQTWVSAGTAGHGIALSGQPTAARDAAMFVAVCRLDTPAAYHSPMSLTGQAGSNQGISLVDGGGGVTLAIVKGGVAAMAETPPLPTGTWLVVVSSWRQADGASYIVAAPVGGGTLYRGTATDTSSMTGGNGTYCVGRGRSDLPSWGGGIATAVAAYEWLPESRAADLLGNPWQIFAPIERRIWVPGVAGGSSVPTITAVSAENITATSADYRVTLDFA